MRAKVGVMRPGEWPRSRYWLIHFLHNRHERPSIRWDAGDELPSRLRRPVADWLAWVTQINPPARTRLINWAARECHADPAYVQSLRLFVREEQHHAEIVERLFTVRGLTGRPAGWKRAAVRTLLRPFGLRFELSLLLLNELAALQMNRLIVEATEDDTVRGVVAQIIRDHERHIAFLSERLTTEFADFNFVRRNLRRWRLRAMFAAAINGAALHHRALLAALGVSRGRFTSQCWRQFERLLPRMVPYHRDELLATLTDHKQRPYAKTVNDG